jgi:hypothetical protein
MIGQEDLGISEKQRKEKYVEIMQRKKMKKG